MSADDLPTLEAILGRGMPQRLPGRDRDAGDDPAPMMSPVDRRKRGLTNRTSYVIGRDGRMAIVHSDLDWSQHVAKTLAAVRALKS